MSGGTLAGSLADATRHAVRRLDFVPPHLGCPAAPSLWLRTTMWMRGLMVRASSIISRAQDVGDGDDRHRISVPARAAAMGVMSSTCGTGG